MRPSNAAAGTPLGGEPSIGFARFLTIETLGDRWMLAWQANANHDSPYSSIGGRFVFPGRALGSPFTIASGSLRTLREPAIGPATDLAMPTAPVTWSDGADLRARRVQQDGTLLGTSGGCFVGVAPNERRLGVGAPDALGNATWGPGLAASGGWSAGDERRFRAWYRDPLLSPCGNGFNLSHGLLLRFEP